MITEEMRKVIADAGLVPAAADVTQLSQAVQRLAARVGATMMWPTPVCPSWALVRDGAAVSRAAFANLFAVLCPTRAANTHTNTTLDGLSTTKDMWVGMPIEGPGIPAGTTVAAITSANAITMSAAATATAAINVTLFFYGYGPGGGAATFGVPDDRGLFERGLDTGTPGFDQSVFTGNTHNNNVIDGIASTVGLYVGQAITGTGIPGGTTIASITSANAITISNAATNTAAVSLTVTGRQIGHAQADDIRSHLHTISMPTQNGVGGTGWGGTSAAAPAAFNTSNTGNAETRPRNRAYLPIIVY